MRLVQLPADQIGVPHLGKGLPQGFLRRDTRSHVCIEQVGDMGAQFSANLGVDLPATDPGTNGVEVSFDVWMTVHSAHAFASPITRSTAARKVTHSLRFALR